MGRIRHLGREYWFDALTALLAVVAILEVALGGGSGDAPRTTRWFEIPAIVVLVLPVFARRRFPFAGPAVFWLLAASISFVDGRLIPFAESLFVLGMADAFLLGKLRDVRQAGIGLVVVVGGTVTIVYNIPNHSASQLTANTRGMKTNWPAECLGML